MTADIQAWPLLEFLAESEVHLFVRFKVHRSGQRVRLAQALEQVSAESLGLHD